MRTVRAANRVEYLTSDLLGCVNAFSTRIGGVSSGEYTKSLNLAFGRGDDEATVLRNLGLFGEAVGFSPESVISLPQIHSDRVLTVTRKDCMRGYFTEADGESDGYVTAERGVTLGIKTADCVPVLMSAKNENGEVFAVAAVHAGWRGTAKGIVANGVAGLLSYGAKPEKIYAAIGPAIGACCFEVGDDCRDEIVAKLGPWSSGFIVRSETSDGKYYPDIKGMNRHILTGLGIPDENIEVSGFCTSCRTDLFYSHRASGGKRGTMLSVICI